MRSGAERQDAAEPLRRAGATTAEPARVSPTRSGGDTGDRAKGGATARRRRQGKRGAHARRGGPGGRTKSRGRRRTEAPRTGAPGVARRRADRDTRGQRQRRVIRGWAGGRPRRDVASGASERGGSRGERPPAACLPSSGGFAFRIQWWILHRSTVGVSSAQWWFRVPNDVVVAAPIDRPRVFVSGVALCCGVRGGGCTDRPCGVVRCCGLFDGLLRCVDWCGVRSDCLGVFVFDVRCVRCFLLFGGLL